MRRMIYISLAAVSLTGCGGSGPNVPSPGAGRAPSPAAAAYRYSACMRQHGVADFPDPQVTSQGGETKIAMMAPRSAVSSPAFKTAQKTCASLMPGPQNPAQRAQEQRQHRIGLLSFARCMRARGVANFPDPNTQGQIPSETLARAGIDIHLPGVIRVALACVPASHGVVTRSEIAQALNRSG